VVEDIWMTHHIWKELAWADLLLGASVCLLNFYLSFLRYPLHRLQGRPRESFAGASGIPVLGSLFVGLSLLGLHHVPHMWPIAIALAALDTGGVHWFAGTMVYRWVRGKRQDEDNPRR